MVDWLRLAVGIILGVVVISILASLGAGFYGDAELNADAGETVTLDTSITHMPSSVEVEATEENAIRLQGGDGHVEATLGNFTAADWTVCVSAEQLTEDVATYDLVAYDNESLLIQRDRDDWAVYYDNGTADGMASIDASGFDSFCSRYDGDGELSIYDGSQYDSDTLTNATTARNVSFTFDGRLDEIRVFNASKDNSTVESYADDPVAPIKNDRVARLMFNEGEGTETTVYYADTTATLIDTGWTDGKPGPELVEEQTVQLAQPDYALEADPFRITILEGGYLDGSPVQFVAWDSLPVRIDFISYMIIFIGLTVIVTIWRNMD